jgi:hypothetical protein
MKRIERGLGLRSWCDVLNDSSIDMRASACAWALSFIETDGETE